MPMTDRLHTGHRQSVRDRIRAATAEAHLALEQRPVMSRVLTDAVTIDDYIAVLRAFVPVHRDLEPALADVTGWRPGGSGERLAALRSDLAALLPAAAPEPPAQALPALAGYASALGGCYVLEGSFLGGAVITAHLRRQFGDTLPLAYFSSADLDSAGRWRRFLALMEAELAEPPAFDQAIEGAAATYQWLQQRLP